MMRRGPPSESPNVRGVGCEMRRQKFQCNLTIELPVARKINFSHSAGAKQRKKLVLMDLSSYRKTTCQSRGSLRSRPNGSL
jgi:hypothetical protein